MIAIWTKFHNLLAGTIHLNNIEHSDEDVYQDTRRIVVAILQHIVYDEWLPVLLQENLPDYEQIYKNEDPQISHLFDATIPLYLYTLIPSLAFKLWSDCSNSKTYSVMRMCNSYDTTSLDDVFIDDGFRKLIDGVLKQSASRDDHFIAEDIRKYAFDSTYMNQQHLIAILIEQSRHFGVPNYLNTRKHLNLDYLTNSTSSNFETLWSFAIKSDKVTSI